MNIIWLWQYMEEIASNVALWRHGQQYSYQDLLVRTQRWEAILDTNNIGSGSRVAIIADYELSSIALLLALIKRQTIIVPLTDDEPAVIEGFIELVGVEAVVDFRQRGDMQLLDRPIPVQHPLIDECLEHETAGLIIFTSGSTGNSKAVLYRIDHLINKFNQPFKKPHRSLVFLKFDHIGGINTLFAVLSQGGALIISHSRQVADICRLIEAAKVSLLPTTPSFLNMLMLSKEHEDFDLNSLEIITYGTEVMPDSTLKTVTKLLPNVKFKQTYGLTELGIMATQSRSSQSKWIRLGGAGVEWKVVSNQLWIKTQTPMLGYLNAPSPFDETGWFNTEDEVEVDGDYLKILGRKSEIINVGGEKVYPQEVEDVLLTMSNICEVLIKGVRNPVTGQTVCAELVVQEEEDVRELRRRLRSYCKGKLARYKIPTQISLSENHFTGKRLKKYRIREGV